MIALVITSSPARVRAGLRRLARAADLVVAADGGARVARAAGVRPHLLIGDQDSLDPVTGRWIADHGIEVMTFPAGKDKTDAELALREAVRRGADEVWLFSAVAGRLDQTLANILLLFTARDLRVKAALFDGRSRAWLAGRAATIQGKPRETVSALALSPTVEGISTRGLRYSLRGGTLRRGSTRGLSNVISAPPALYRLQRGDLLIVHTPRRGASAQPG